MGEFNEIRYVVAGDSSVSYECGKRAEQSNSFIFYVTLDFTNGKQLGNAVSLNPGLFDSATLLKLVTVTGEDVS